eukprot:1974958-Rhodomonas_salina.1
MVSSCLAQDPNLRPSSQVRCYAECYAGCYAECSALPCTALGYLPTGCRSIAAYYLAYRPMRLLVPGELSA